MADIMQFFLPIDKMSKYTAIEQIIKINEKTYEYGLTLTYSDAVELIETRSISLSENGRVEIGSATIGKIIEAFCDSAFIIQQDYAETINQLVEIFYYIKNETLELISDDELIDLMKDYFENSCKGSLDLLKDRELEKMARNIRFGIDDYTNVCEFEEEDLDEEE